MNISAMDSLAAKLIAQIQIADINDLLSGPGIRDELHEGDLRTCFQMMQRDLEIQLQTLERQIFAPQILTDENKNHAAFARLLEEEKQAFADHRFAMRLAGMTVNDTDEIHASVKTSSPGRELSLSSNLKPGTISKSITNGFGHSIIGRAPLHGIRSVAAGTVIDHAESYLPSSSYLSKCNACMEYAPRQSTLTLDCKTDPHTYCRACLIDLFTSAIANTTLFPSRCCKVAIDLDICRTSLSKELVTKFDLQVEELATPNPTYCSNAACSEFIRSMNIRAGFAKCLHCTEKTCVRCKCKENDGLCPSDPHVQLLLDVAKRVKWQQCTNCNNMVELSQGCFHMICRCRYQFCYLCGAKWKSCTCPQWDEDYLTRPAQADPHPDNPQPAPIPAPARPHEHSWSRLLGHDCQGCGADYLQYVMQCRGCNTSNYWRCIHNRD